MKFATALACLSFGSVLAAPVIMKQDPLVSLEATVSVLAQTVQANLGTILVTINVGGLTEVNAPIVKGALVEIETALSGTVNGLGPVLGSIVLPLESAELSLLSSTVASLEQITTGLDSVLSQLVGSAETTVVALVGAEVNAVVNIAEPLVTPILGVVGNLLGSLVGGDVQVVSGIFVSVTNINNSTGELTSATGAVGAVLKMVL